MVSAPAIETGRRYPLILDFHGAIAPSRKGASLTAARLWRAFAKRAGCIVVGPNGRTRAWGMTKGANNDKAYALAILDKVLADYPVDPKRIYIAGFSSGSDFVCRAGLQSERRFAGCLVVCPGPPHVLGLRGGELLKAKDTPFYFVTGEEDYVRKSGAWQAYVVLEEAGCRVRYREVPGVAHAFPPLDEYVTALRWLEGRAKATDTASLAEGRKAVARAAALSETELGRVYEAWWRVQVRFHSLPEIARRAARALATLDEKYGTRELYRARRRWFKTRGAAEAKPTAWTFDRYLSASEVAERLAALAREHPDRVRLTSIGKSIEGRDIEVIELTNHATGTAAKRPAVWVQGAIHGNEASAAMVTLYFAWQLGANPDQRRGIERLLSRYTVYVAPVVNPDGLEHFITKPSSLWRPRFNMRPNDADGDGRTDEDPYEDLDGDGEISQMYVADDKAPFVLKDGRLVRGKQGQHYRHVGREGIDNDGDGKFSEDPEGGVNLNRNFPVGFKARRDFEGSRGTGPASEPETRAVMRFVETHSNIALFLDYHNDAKCVFYWLGDGAPVTLRADHAMHEALAGRARKTLGYTPRPLQHAGAGLSIAWSYGALGLPSAILELEPGRVPPDARDFVAAHPFEHPQLGVILLGGDWRKLAKRNPKPRDIVWQAKRNWDFLKKEIERLPRLAFEQPRIVPAEGGYELTGVVANLGALPLATERAKQQGVAVPVRLRVEGATVTGDLELAPLAGGERASFRSRLRDVGASVTLVASHPKGGELRLPLLRPRVPTVAVRRRYAILPGYATVETADRTELGTDHGPRFTLRHRKKTLRVAVLLGEFADQRHGLAREDIAKAWFTIGSYRRSPTGQHAYGSLRDFYREMSYGAQDIDGKVFEWVTLPGQYDDYRRASFGSSKFRDALETAVLARDGKDALEGYDCIVFVWAGNPVRRVSNLWPMRLTLKHRPGVIAFKTGELYKGQAAAIGVACHEMGHTFGVNDKYGLGAPERPMGKWCLMCKGTHGAGASGYRRPFHLCVWCKSVIGWVKPCVITPAAKPQQLALRPITFGPRECYRILLKSDGSEYLLLENRRREGFMTELPSPGLAVLRVGPDDRPSAPQSRVQLLCAHGLPPATRSDLAKPEAVAWPQDGRTELVVDGVRLSRIRLVDDVVYFEVAQDMTADRFVAELARAKSTPWETMQRFAARADAPKAIPKLLDLMAKHAPRLDNDVCLTIELILGRHSKARCPLEPLLAPLSRRIWNSQQKAAQALYVALQRDKPGSLREAVARALVPLTTSQRSRVYEAGVRCLRLVSGRDYGPDPARWKAWFEAEFKSELDLSKSVYEVVAVVKQPERLADLVRDLKARCARTPKGIAFSVVVQMPGKVDPQTIDRWLDQWLPLLREFPHVTFSPASDRFRAPWR